LEDVADLLALAVALLAEPALPVVLAAFEEVAAEAVVLAAAADPPIGAVD